MFLRGDLREEYGFLDVQGRVVVDVGASIGGSPIYFELGGARRVIALEPYPYSLWCCAQEH